MLATNLASLILKCCSVNPDTNNKKQQIFAFTGHAKSKEGQLCDAVNDE